MRRERPFTGLVGAADVGEAPIGAAEGAETEVGVADTPLGAAEGV